MVREHVPHGVKSLQTSREQLEPAIWLSRCKFYGKVPSVLGGHEYSTFLALGLNIITKATFMNQAFWIFLTLRMYLVCIFSELLKDVLKFLVTTVGMSLHKVLYCFLIHWNYVIGSIVFNFVYYYDKFSGLLSWSNVLWLLFFLSYTTCLLNIKLLKDGFLCTIHTSYYIFHIFDFSCFYILLFSIFYK